MINWKRFALIEAIILIVAIFAFSLYYFYNINKKNEDGLLSKRIYTGVLESGSHLIFNFRPLQIALKEYTEKQNGTIGIYVLNLRDGASMGVNEEEEFEPASLNKVVIAIIIFSQIEKGKLSLETELPINPEDRDSSSGTLYASAADRLSVDQLLRAMLSESDNTALRVFNRYVTLSDWKDLSEYLDYYRVNSETEKNPVIEYHSVTPESNARIFTSLYLSTILKSENSEYILRNLINTSFDIKKIANLPENITVAQKFGRYERERNYFHSCGIMYVEESRFFYCVMTKDIPKKEAEEIIGAVVHATYEYVQKMRTILKNKNIS